MKTIWIYREYIKIALGILLLVAVFYVLHKQVSVESIMEAGGVSALALTIFAETGLLIGFFLPGDTLLFAAGFFAAQDTLPLVFTTIALFIAAVTGNMVGYEIGRRSGRRLFKSESSVFFHKENIDRAQGFFDKHGGKTIIFARFIPVVRTIASPLAGMGHMNYAKFMLYNIIGAILWVPVLVMVGYWAGKVLGEFIDIDKYILPLVVFATLATFGASFAHVLRDPVSRQKLKEKFLSLKRG